MPPSLHQCPSHHKHIIITLIFQLGHLLYEQYIRCIENTSGSNVYLRRRTVGCEHHMCLNRGEMTAGDMTIWW